MALTPKQLAEIKARLAQKKGAQEPEKKPAKRTATPRTEAPVERDGRLNYGKMMEDRARFGNSSNSEFLRAAQLPQGYTKLRFMMNPSSDAFYAFRVGGWLRREGEDGEMVAERYVSPTTEDPGAFCPAKQLSEALRKYGKSFSGEEANRALALAKELYPKSEFMSNVLVYKPEARAWEHAVFCYGVSIFKGLVDSTRANVDSEDDLDEGYLSDELNFADAEQGRIVSILKEGERKGTTYTVTVTPKTRPVTEDELSQRVDLDEFCEPTSREELESALCAVFDVDDFSYLLANIGQVELPEPQYEDSMTNARKKNGAQQDGKKSPQRERNGGNVTGKRRQQREVLEEQEETAVTTDDADIPECIANYGSPMKGLRCSKCPCAEECEQISSTE